MKRYLNAALLIIAITSYQNCSLGAFRAAQKMQVLESSSVFGASDGDGQDANGTSTPDQAQLPRVPDVLDPAKPPPPPPPPPPPSRPTIPLQFTCSNLWTANAGGNLSNIPYVIVRLYSSLRLYTEISCSYTDAAAPAAMLAAHGIPGSVFDKLEMSCANVPDGQYMLDFATPAGNSLLMARGNMNVIKSGNKMVSTSNPAIPVPITVDLNPPQKVNNCDLIGTPLLVVLSDKKPEPLKLTSQEKGIRFDLLGENAEPIPHTKKQISWYHQEDYYFITLPDAHGEVNGINELFGDNTKGPDGKFEANGYLALAKYDTNKDKWITKSDAVFEKLRLWKDDNADGVAQSSELHTFAEKKVNGVDLSADASFREVDAYGNETRLKSVVRTEDGQYHLMFDLWFRYLN